MAKSLLLSLCCICLFHALRAQDYRSTDTVIPQKLDLKKSSLTWTDHPNYFKKSPATDQDSGESILYLGPPKKDTFNLELPRMQSSGISFRASAHRPLPLFRIQQ